MLRHGSVKYSAIAIRIALGLAGSVLASAVVAEQPGGEQSRGVEIVRPAGPAQAPLTACPRPIADPGVVLEATTRASAFDKRMRDRLAARPASLAITIADPFPLGSDGPPQLQPWLGEARAQGGLVTVSHYCGTPRGLFGWLKKVFTGGLRNGYAAIDGYDIVLHADGTTDRVTQVELKLRQGSAG